MKNQTQSNFSGGLILISLGIIFLAIQIWPDTVKQLLGETQSWPMLIIAIGVIFWLAALLGRSYGLVIPGTILAAIGGILYYQNRSGDWESWAYVWPLVPASVGLGLALFGLLHGQKGKPSRKTGFYMFSISVAVFFIFWSMFTAALDFRLVWAVLMIAAGILLVLRTFSRSKN